ncbi:hypothetical protein IMG5_150740 [Ichthyophthirius multifiliis]|uniref:Uncharacterized protein n=1 Tax=Ichthyophthirius multifiliis TaxID=5932 RepID=G0QYM2_ICHMU|nr:hypothetical protein IMG5_150740 [Ichthyophthirius multifiliis]EGR29678.1 hypothetical protein IMG5_150740 [Ichthyophthirius multifiliis]|eukprot:XP_004030914.1 hypothetical protein IMG5_150740 [Ichthyophthirius multifiliis]
MLLGLQIMQYQENNQIHYQQFFLEQQIPITMIFFQKLNQKIIQAQNQTQKIVKQNTSKRLHGNILHVKYQNHNRQYYTFKQKKKYLLIQIQKISYKQNFRTKILLIIYLNQQIYPQQLRRMKPILYSQTQIEISAKFLLHKVKMIKFYKQGFQINKQIQITNLVKKQVQNFLLKQTKKQVQKLNQLEQN